MSNSEESISGWLENENNLGTRLVHEGYEPDQWKYRMLVPPVITSTTFQQSAPGENVDQINYGRFNNPTRRALEKSLADLDNAKFALTFPSGMGGVTVIGFLLHAGDHILCVDDVYAGSSLTFTRILNRYNITASFADFTKPEDVRKAIKPNTKMIWFESPTNPLLKIVDIKQISDLVRSINPNIIQVIDNTFITAYYQRPLQFGVDIVHYSLTKFTNGHHDAIMGSLATNREDLYKELKFLQSNLGVVPSPFDCYLVHRSLRTLKLRMEKHFRNSLEVAKYLAKHPNVEKVIHPGLESHPQHEIAKKQSSGHSGMVTVFLKGGFDEASKFTTSLKVINLADSLGGVETTVVLPAVSTRGYVDTSLVDRSAITDNMIRMSIGIEDVEDIINDFEQALNLTYS